MRRRSYALVLGTCAVAVAAVIGFAFGNAGQSSAAISATSSGASLQDTFVSVFQQVSPSVVQIETSDGLGSGIVLDGKGDIVTNAHVVGTAKTFRVTTPAGKILKGSLVGMFAADDIAVIKATGGSLRAATFADSNALRVGDIAMAIGNPLGLQSSFTEGVVSALGRDEAEGNGVTLRNAIQTSAAINPGNSGGALVDITGKVIGIPTLAANDPQLGGAAAGIGFAIPGNDVRDYANQIIQHGHVVDTHRAYLGVQIGETSQGVYIGAVTAGGPAAMAGLQMGDVITAVDGKSTMTDDSLGAVLAAKKPGQTVTVKVIGQTGSARSVKLTLGQYPGS
ncbi:MAG TPA: trypsin-like peptidase domain-containing protein [Gaiellales bacterium]